VRPRTLWEQGRRPARLVGLAAGVAVLVVVLLDVAAFGELNVVFDVAFVLVCAAAALTVRPREFFAVGVCPPLLMAGTFVVVAAAWRGALGDPTDGFAQAVVSGLAHHAKALVIGYALTLALLAVRQTALRHHGTIRGGRQRR
jgi:hypothetical protein